jgi:hypothetical protein
MTPPPPPPPFSCSVSAAAEHRCGQQLNRSKFVLLLNLRLLFSCPFSFFPSSHFLLIWPFLALTSCCCISCLWSLLFFSLLCCCCCCCCCCHLLFPSFPLQTSADFVLSSVVLPCLPLPLLASQFTRTLRSLSLLLAIASCPLPTCRLVLICLAASLPACVGPSLRHRIRLKLSILPNLLAARR